MQVCAVEFRKYVEKDAALERRFQPVHVHEPTAEQALTILEVWLPASPTSPSYCTRDGKWDSMLHAIAALQWSLPSKCTCT